LRGLIGGEQKRGATKLGFALMLRFYTERGRMAAPGLLDDADLLGGEAVRVLLAGVDEDLQLDDPASPGDRSS
jgi:hypothetical protein